jgi:hypothetical protein
MGRVCRSSFPPFDTEEISTENLRRIDKHKLRGSPYVDLVEPDKPKPDDPELPLAILLSPLLVFGVPIWAIAGAFVGGGSYWWIGAAAIIALSALMAVV